MEIGSLLLEDGLTRSVEPRDGARFSHEELQFFVGGYLEIIPMKNPAPHLTLYANEEGKRLRMKRNPLGTLLAQCPPGDPIVGPVLLVHEVQPNTIPRTCVEISAAHDTLNVVIEKNMEIDPLAHAAIVGALKVLCWVLGHRTNGDVFERNLAEINKRLRDAGYVVAH